MGHKVEIQRRGVFWKVSRPKSILDKLPVLQVTHDIFLSFFLRHISIISVLDKTIWSWEERYFVYFYITFSSFVLSRFWLESTLWFSENTIQDNMWPRKSRKTLDKSKSNFLSRVWNKIYSLLKQFIWDEEY